LSQIFDELGIEIQELKQIEDRTIVITKAITRRQLEKMTTTGVKILASYKIL
jgi:homoserine dehydrogenase